jgi:hypothetical protein
MPSSGMLRRVALVRTDVLEDRSASIIRVTRIGELGTLERASVAGYGEHCSYLADLSNLMLEALRSSESSVLARPTPRPVSEDDILHSHRRENLKSYIALTSWTL